MISLAVEYTKNKKYKMFLYLNAQRPLIIFNNTENLISAKHYIPCFMYIIFLPVI